MLKCSLGYMIEDALLCLKKRRPIVSDILVSLQNSNSGDNMILAKGLNSIIIVSLLCMGCDDNAHDVTDIPGNTTALADNEREVAPDIDTVERFFPRGMTDKEMQKSKTGLHIEQEHKFFYYEESEQQLISSETSEITRSLSSLSVWPSLHSPVSEGFQAAYRYLGNSANNDKRGGWFDELQGIANDDSHWYFSKNQTDSDNSKIFKVPFSGHLGHNFDIVETWTGRISDCKHVGDLDYHKHNGKGYLVVGADKCGDGHARFAIFRAEDLSLAAQFEDRMDLQHKKAPIVAIREGKIYSAKGSRNVEVIHEWAINWGLIPHIGGSIYPLNEADHREFKIDNIAYTGGWQENKLHHVQGAAFSSDGQIFYVAVGYCKWVAATCKWCAPRQIYAFMYKEEGSWPLLKASSYTDGPFKYPVDTRNPGGCDEEPEGLTYYDFNKVDNYHEDMKRGELVAILLNNGYPVDKVWIKHYTSIIDVTPGEGINYSLFDRWDGHGAWNGSILALESGIYRESLHVDGNNLFVKIVPENGGSATIRP